MKEIKNNDSVVLNIGKRNIDKQYACSIRILYFYNEIIYYKKILFNKMLDELNVCSKTLRNYIAVINMSFGFPTPTTKELVIENGYIIYVE